MMKPDRIMSSDLLDILFEDRNKEYGAYELRKNYKHRLLMALASVPVLAGLFLWMNYLNKTFQTDLLGDLWKDSTVVKLISIPQPEPEKPLEAPKQKKIATIKEVTPVIVPDHVKTEPLPTVEQLLDDTKAIAGFTQDGEPPSEAASPTAPGEPGGTGNAPAETPPAPEVEKVLVVAEMMPEFPGGADALRRFLGRNLRVPENSVEVGQRVKVPVRFVVNKGGEISDVEFLVQVDESLRNEVLRVMRKMPKWKPGSQNGRLVPVYFVIPIIFEVGE